MALTSQTTTHSAAWSAPGPPGKRDAYACLGQRHNRLELLLHEKRKVDSSILPVSAASRFTVCVCGSTRLVMFPQVKWRLGVQ